MAVGVEVVITPDAVENAKLFTRETARAATQDGDDVLVTRRYYGGREWLVLYGIGKEPRPEWRDQHIAAGGKVLIWDLGYWHRYRDTGYMRCSINDDHPQRWLDKTAPHKSRFNALGIEVRETFKRDGHIILAGLGKKSRIYTGEHDWEERKLAELRARFPGRRILYRPKPGSVPLQLNCETVAHGTIQDWLRNASLVVCRHSNVAVDAIVSGVPYECEGGAAQWFVGKPFTRESRLDFLRRLAWWQWNAREVLQAWRFVKAMACG